MEKLVHWCRHVVGITPACCNGIMHFNHYGRAAVALGVDLVNRPVRDEGELEQRCADGGFLLDHAVTTADLEVVDAFLSDWSAVADLTGDEERAQELNKLLASYTQAPYLTNHDGSGWHLHYRTDSLPAGQHLAAVIAAGTALHLTALGMSRFGRCGSQDCTQLFVDTSRNGRQRYCSSGCANREAVRRHRAHAASQGRVKVRRSSGTTWGIEPPSSATNLPNSHSLRDYRLSATPDCAMLGG